MEDGHGRAYAPYGVLRLNLRDCLSMTKTPLAYNYKVCLGTQIPQIQKNLRNLRNLRGKFLRLLSSSLIGQSLIIIQCGCPYDENRKDILGTLH